MTRKPRVVLDSVVAVSSFLTTGLTAELVLLCEEKVDLYTAEKILQEIRYVLLAKPHIRNRYFFWCLLYTFCATMLARIPRILSHRSSI